MSIEIKKKTVEVVFASDGTGRIRGNVDKGNLKDYGRTLTKREQEEVDRVKALRLHFSLVGEAAPKLSPLSPDFPIDKQTTLYRYDWIVGASSFYPFYNWNWFGTIAKDRAMIVQLLLDTGKSGCWVSESNAFLMGLLPSRETSSLFEEDLHALASGSEKMAKYAENYKGPGETVLKTSAVVSNFVLSNGSRFRRILGFGPKNWFLYRFLDFERRCCAVEWNISRNVLHKFGPALRGSILLAFHGTANPPEPVRLLLRPRLNFSPGTMNFDPPYEQLEADDKVELEVKPIAG